jgi:hypothetical protein
LKSAKKLSYFFVVAQNSKQPASIAGLYSGTQEKAAAADPSAKH